MAKLSCLKGRLGDYFSDLTSSFFDAREKGIVKECLVTHIPYLVIVSYVNFHKYWFSANKPSCIVIALAPFFT